MWEVRDSLRPRSKLPNLHCSSCADCCSCWFIKLPFIFVMIMVIHYNLPNSVNDTIEVVINAPSAGYQYLLHRNYLNSKVDYEGNIATYSTHIFTDKPVYRTGEVLYFKILVLDNTTMAPLPDHRVDRAFIPRAEILDARGAVVHRITHLSCIPPYIHGQFYISNMPGGEYSIRIPEQTKITRSVREYIPSERQFRIRSYRNARLLLDLEFHDKGYGPGDNVTALLKAKRVEGGTPAGAKITSIARIDGVEVYRTTDTISVVGMAEVRFKLPNNITVGEGSLTVVVDDGGNSETKSKTIPLIIENSKKLTIDFVTESTNQAIIVGLENKIYFSATTPSQEPVDVVGQVWAKDKNNETKLVVVNIKAQHEGRGFFTIPKNTITVDSKLEFRVISPSNVKPIGIKLRNRVSGVTITEVAQVYNQDEDIQVTVMSHPHFFNLTVKLYHRSQEISSTPVNIGETNQLRVVLANGYSLDKHVRGVLRAVAVACHGEYCAVVAERLLFRRLENDNDLTTIDIKADRQEYTPGSTVRLSIIVENKNRMKPISANIGVSITDLSALEIIEKRLRAPNIKTAVFLEDEVDELKDSQVYLNSTISPNDNSEINADTAVDLLLVTQGWRSFLPRDQLMHTHPKQATPSNSLMSREQKLDLLSEYRWEEFNRKMFWIVLPSRHDSGRGLFTTDYDKSSWQYRASSLNGGDDDQILKQDNEERLNIDRGVTKEEFIVDGEAPVINAIPERVEIFDVIDREPTGDSPQHSNFINAILGASSEDEEDKRLETLIDLRDYYSLVRQWSNHRSQQRSDFTETLFWMPGYEIQTSLNRLRIEVQFKLSDSISSFKVQVDGLIFEPIKSSISGRSLFQIVSADKLIVSKIPFYTEVKVPLTIQMGDEPLIPVTLVNDVSYAQDVVFEVAAKNGLAIKDYRTAENTMLLESQQRKRIYVPMKVTNATKASVTIHSAAGMVYASDNIVREVEIRPSGFPNTFYASQHIGSLSTWNFSIPMSLFTHYIRETANMKFTIQTASINSFEKSLDAFIRIPYGCFEQTSSTTYPMLMALQYYQSHGYNGHKVNNIVHLLRQGYKRLVGFQALDGGFNYFGGFFSDYFITSMGLSQFLDMKKQVPGLVDDYVIRDASNWLSKTDVPRDQRGAYAIYSLSKAYGSRTLELYPNLLSSIPLLTSDALKSGCSYKKAITANFLINLNISPEVVVILADSLLKKAQSDGLITGAERSATYSQGDSLYQEATSLTAMAWMKAMIIKSGNGSSKYYRPAQRSITYLMNRCSGGMWASTQATVLALQAIFMWEENFVSGLLGKVEPDEKNKEVAYYQIGEDIKHMVPICAGDTALFDTKPIANEIFDRILPQGKNDTNMTENVQVQVVYKGKLQNVAINFELDYFTVMKASSDDCQIELKTTLANRVVNEGESTEIVVEIINKKNTRAWMPLAIVGIPAGLEIRVEKLEEMKKEGLVSYYEMDPGKLVLYWEELEGGKSKRVPIDVVAAIAGEYSGPASIGYLYYFSEAKVYVDPLKVSIVPAKTE
eukprot:TRINITY_DN502_c0_g1_i1.p1 TRINITY_DN502_c0_g1~~TRINITY_DN502_c0_g1_i1.p1  ORF type:complete len:1532 (-),score=221.33 TRINITY_DN502_c0_g1_i1:250-4845(-)